MTEPPGSAERWQRVRQLFDSAQSIDAEQRAQWLASECGEDDELRETLDGLLAAARAKTEIIDVTINSASTHFLHNLHCEPPSDMPASEALPLSNNSRRALACLEAFFYSSARAGREINPVRANVDLDLAQAFGRAANGPDVREPAVRIKRLLESLHDGDASHDTLAALHYWLSLIEDGCVRK